MCESGTYSGIRVGVDFSLVDDSVYQKCWCYVQVYKPGKIFIASPVKPGPGACGISVNIQEGDILSGYGCSGVSHISNELTTEVASIESRKTPPPYEHYKIQYCLAVRSSPDGEVKITCCADNKTDCYSPIGEGTTTASTIPTTTVQTEITTSPSPIKITPGTTRAKPTTPEHTSQKLTTEKFITTKPTSLQSSTLEPTLTNTESCTCPCPDCANEENKQLTEKSCSGEKVSVEIVVPVVIVAVVFCVGTVIGAIIYVRRHTRSQEDPTYDRHANTPLDDIHPYQDIRHINVSSNT